ncbi:SMP-30/gluconolactonase/LRE family protein [Mesorhizobium sp. CGMCC 1.15528]|uniref:SMP-30/gluconolactonase/LRE family protein n=1 Tax=Mesorhizobium zhangyense TaxID=1776730 RepID=A0A7C9V6R3_9HYPH|nr:SMP-30/gluconolactonase/LRE family protein [Mesorhizobium zhangyense]NGN41724.1 SMP-30/gluconolactonase/LRE family protein [Mesorhizobium zhangyense]
MYTAWFEVFDPRFERLILSNVHVDTLFSGGRWLEGPVYVPASRHLLFSDIPNNRVMRYNECDDSISVFQSPSNFSNGHTLDAQGRVVSCEHLMRRVTRTEHSGDITVIADRFDGKRLNSPNDVVVGRDGAIWFTDPTYGIATEYEGSRSESEIGSSNVYRIDADGSISLVADGFVQPNGLCFSRDERVLYIADSGARPGQLLAFEVVEGRSLTNRRLLRECEIGIYDGFRVDRDGNIWTSAGDGVHCLSADGTLLGKIKLPEAVANVCFGGPNFNRLYICATRTLFAVYLNTTSPHESEAA